MSKHAPFGYLYVFGTEARLRRATKAEAEASSQAPGGLITVPYADGLTHTAFVADEHKSALLPDVVLTPTTSACCREPKVRGGRCDNCETWLADALSAP